MAASIEQLGKTLTVSGLFTADELKGLWAALPAETRPKTGEAFAQWLVEQGKLTQFQADELLAGRGASLVMGDYVLVEELGAGGMGKVYKARHRTMQRIVALKVMSQAAMQDEAAVKRFQREVRAAAKLEHPNIVTAYDSGTAGEVRYLVMQFVDGGDLASLVRHHGVLDVERAVEYVCQAAQGLAYAHGEGVVHRDIKPANLLVDKRGVVKILDMGLARIDDTSSSDGLTGTEQVMGTVDYMSPEQAADTKHVDGRTDIYSLGCTLWYLLTGKRMFDGDTAIKRLMKHRDQPRPSLVKTRDDVSWPLEQVFHKMTAVEPQNRYQSMDEVLTALESHRPSRTGISPTGMGSSLGMGGGPRDAELSAFLRTVGPAGTQTGAASKSPATAADSPTAMHALAQVETDPKSEMLAPSVKPVSRDAQRSGVITSAGPPVKLIAAGVGVCAALFIGALVFFMTRGGDEAVLAPGEHTGGDARIAASPAPGGSPGAKKVAPSPAVAPFDAATARKHQQAWSAYLGVPVETTNSLDMKLVLIPPGEFLMGSSDTEIAELLKQNEQVRKTNPVAADMSAMIRSEGPQHAVTITQPFYMGATEVTVGQFRKFCEGANYQSDGERNPTADTKKAGLTWRTPGYDTADDYPASFLSWNDVIAFCRWLSRQEKLPSAYQDHLTLGVLPVTSSIGYRLPTEAEWEYACRAGTTTPFFWGDDLAAGNDYAAFKKAAPVGSRRPNAFGLYDLIGNVTEYCQDWYDSGYYAVSPKVDPPGGSGVTITLRGSVFISGSHRSAERNSGPPERHQYHYGFRVVRTVPQPTSTPRSLTVTTPASTATVSSAPSFLSALSPTSAPPSAGDGAATTNDSPAATSEEQIALAERIVAQGGQARFGVSGLPTEINFKTRADLNGLNKPYLTMIDARGTTLIPAEVSVLTRSPFLSSVSLDHCIWVTDDVVRKLCRNKTLRLLRIANTSATRAVVPDIAALTELQTLYCSNLDFNDDDLLRLASLPNLSGVQFDNLPITSAGIAHLAKFPKLRSLTMRQVPIDEAGLERLAKLTGLTDMNITNSGITAAQLAKLKAALPQCTFNWNSPSSEPQP